MSALFQPANMLLFAVLVPLSAPVFFSLMCGQENSTKVKRKAELEFSPVTLVTLRKQGPVLSSPWNTSAPSDQITPPPPSLPLPSDTNTAPHQETQHNWSTGLVHDPPMPCTSARTTVQHREFMKIPAFSAGLHLHCHMCLHFHMCHMKICVFFIQIQETTTSQKEDIQEILRHVRTPIISVTISKKPNTL